LEHRHEPVNFGWDGRIADVFTGWFALDGSIGIDEQLALLIKKYNERDTHRFTAKIAKEFLGARAIQFWMFAPLFKNIKISEDKILIQDRTNFGISHEGFNLSAGWTPGRAEDEKDGFVLRNSVRFGGY
jgi:hypothetical protein